MAIFQAVYFPLQLFCSAIGMEALLIMYVYWWVGVPLLPPGSG